MKLRYQSHQINTSSKTCNLEVDDAFRNRYINVIGCFLYLVSFVSGSCFLGREPFQHPIMPILQLATEITSFASKLQRLYQVRKIVVCVRAASNLKWGSLFQLPSSVISVSSDIIISMSRISLFNTLPSLAMASVSCCKTWQCTNYWVQEVNYKLNSGVSCCIATKLAN